MLLNINFFVFVLNHRLFKFFLNSWCPDPFITPFSVWL